MSVPLAISAPRLLLSIPPSYHMSQLDLANAKLAEALDLLALAEDVILGLRSGRGCPGFVTKGVWGKENDKAGLRALAARGAKTKKEEGFGKLVWFETDDPSFIARTSLPISEESAIPSLPTEVFHQIASHCDPPTLSRLCQTASFLREVASPVLYKRLDISSPEAFDPFTRRKPVSARFAEQGSSLTLDRATVIRLRCHFDRKDPGGRRRSRANLRHYTSVPLPAIQHIHLHICDNMSCDIFPETIHSLLRMTNPISLSFDFPPTKSPLYSIQFSSPLWTTITSRWTRLDTLVSRGAGFLVQKLARVTSVSTSEPPLRTIIDLSDPVALAREEKVAGEGRIRAVDEALGLGFLPSEHPLSVFLPSDSDRNRIEAEMTRRFGGTMGVVFGVGRARVEAFD